MNVINPETDMRHSLKFEKVSFTVKLKKENKVIINDINGLVPSGRMMAIMGPSGAGKTTLINVLTLNAFGGVAQGNVTLDGERMTLPLFKRRCAVVTQEDYHWAFLTCKETILFAARLYMTTTEEEREKAVSTLLTDLGLTTCADTKVGNMFMKGMSGGQKKRLSIALALVKRPTLIYLDEPTSGLDSAAAMGVMQNIKKLAKAENLIVCATIHQPSTSVYNSFDKVMVLSKGRVAYNGPGDQAESYFKSIGHPMPLQTNPAEFMLDVVNAEFSDPAQVDEILGKWQTSALRDEALAVHPLSPVVKKSGQATIATGLCSQVMTLLKRHSLITLRDPSLYLGRMIMFLFATCFFAVIYISARDRVQSQVLFRMFLIMWFVGVPTSLGVVVVYVYNEEYKAIRKECKNGMVNPTAYLIARMLIELPMMIILSISALAVAAYGIAAFNPENFVVMIFTYAIQLWAFEAMAEMFAVSAENPLLGMLQYMNNWFSAFLFAGVMVPEKDVIWPFRLFCYILPLRWGLQSMVYIEYSDTSFSGASVDPCPAISTAGTNGTDPLCVYHKELGANAAGFKCTNPDPLACYGHTGHQVLESIGRNYQSISSSDTVGTDIAYVLIIGAVFKLFYMVLLTVNVNKVAVVKSPTPKKGSIEVHPVSGQ